MFWCASWRALNQTKKHSEQYYQHYDAQDGPDDVPKHNTNGAD